MLFPWRSIVYRVLHCGRWKRGQWMKNSFQQHVIHGQHVSSFLLEVFYFCRLRLRLFHPSRSRLREGKGRKASSKKLVRLNLNACFILTDFLIKSFKVTSCRWQKFTSNVLIHALNLSHNVILIMKILKLWVGNKTFSLLRDHWWMLGMKCNILSCRIHTPSTCRSEAQINVST